MSAMINTSSVCQGAEWHRATFALMHTPSGTELVVTGLHSPAALFEAPFDPEHAAKNHACFAHQLTDDGCVVILLTEALLQGTMDAAGNAVEGPALDNLRQLARDSISVVADDEAAARRHVDASIAAYLPATLVQVILQQPELRIVTTGTNTGFAATYIVRPLMNLFFMRDQTITTRRGVYLMNLSSPQRRMESRIVAAALRNLGVAIRGRVTAPETMEGGDFLPAGDVAFQGQGLRTTPGAIQQLMQQDAYGTRFVAVVKDGLRDQEEMHLDTYFNIIGPTTAVLVESRLTAEPGEPRFTVVDVYERNPEDGTHALARSDVPFVEYLRQAGFTTIIPVPKADQLIYGCNFLTVSPTRVLMPRRGDGISEPYRSALKAAGVTVEDVEMTSMTKGYGAAHCTTQVWRTADATPAAAATCLLS